MCLDTYIILMDISFLGKNPKKFNFSNFSLLLYYERTRLFINPIQSYLNEIPHQFIVSVLIYQYGTKIYNGRLFEQYQSMTLFPKISLQAMLLHISDVSRPPQLNPNVKVSQISSLKKKYIEGRSLTFFSIFFPRIVQQYMRI